MKNQKISIASEPTCYIHFSDGKNCNVTLRSGITVSEMLKEVAAYNQVDNQVSLFDNGLVYLSIFSDGRLVANWRKFCRRVDHGTGRV